MTETEKDTEATPATPTPVAVKKPTNADRQRAVLPVLEQLFETCPHLFGAEFLPLKLGIFQEILTAYPDKFKKDTLRAALGVHTRSTRYLHAVAAGNWRHDLTGSAVESVAPEHVFASILELYRRRQARQKTDLRPQVVQQILAAFGASGLSRQDYEILVHSADEQTNAFLKEALDIDDMARARQVATARAFEASGKTPEEFADMYGMEVAEVVRALERSRNLQAG
jgi:sRNA-binding protein